MNQNNKSIYFCLRSESSCSKSKSMACWNIVLVNCEWSIITTLLNFVLIPRHRFESAAELTQITLLFVPTCSSLTAHTPPAHFTVVSKSGRVL